MIFCTLGNFLKPLATISLPKSLPLLGTFCKGVKIYHFSSEIIFGQLLRTFGDFSGHTEREAFLVPDIHKAICLTQKSIKMLLRF